MKKCVPLLLLLTFSWCLTAVAQSRKPVKTYKVDSCVNETIFCSYPADIGAEFPGGIAPWRHFIQRNLKYPPAALKANIQGTVDINFTVNPDGKVTDIIAVSGPEELKQAAVDVISKSPQWIPAVQRNHKVKDYKTQPFTFRLPG